RRELAHHRPGRLPVVAGLDLALELVEEREPVPFRLVSEHVDEPAVAVDPAQVRAQSAWEEERRDREVLAACPGGDRGDGRRVHPGKIAFRWLARQTGACPARTEVVESE